MKMNIKVRRWKLLKIGCDMVANMFVDGFPSTVKEFIKDYDIPEDAEYVKCHLDIITDSFAFVIRHDSWDIVPTGEVPPNVEKRESWDIDKANPNDRVLGVVNSDGTVQVSGHTFLKIPEPTYINGACTPNSIEECPNLNGWVNVIGEEYPKSEPRYMMCHIPADELPIDDFNHMIFNSNSPIRTKHNIPDGSKCIKYYSDIVTGMYHILFSNELFEIWYGYEGVMKEITEGKCDMFIRRTADVTNNTPSAGFKSAPEDALDSFLDKYSTEDE